MLLFIGHIVKAGKAASFWLTNLLVVYVGFSTYSSTHFITLNRSNDTKVNMNILLVIRLKTSNLFMIYCCIIGLTKYWSFMIKINICLYFSHSASSLCSLNCMWNKCKQWAKFECRGPRILFVKIWNSPAIVEQNFWGHLDHWRKFIWQIWKSQRVLSPANWKFFHLSAPSNLARERERERTEADPTVLAGVGYQRHGEVTNHLPYSRVADLIKHD